MPWTPLDEAEPLPHRHLRVEETRRTQAAFLRSPNVLSAAAARLHAEHSTLLAGEADPMKWLDDHLRVDDVGASLLAVSTPGLSRAEQAAVVNTVVEEFQAMSETWDSSTRTLHGEAAARALATYRQDLAAKRRALREDNLGPERQAALRDEIGVLEELARRVAFKAERLRLERDGEAPVRLVAKAFP